MAAFMIELEPKLEVEEMPTEKLFDFLYKVGHHGLCPTISRMFNCDLSFEDTILSKMPYFEKTEVQFTECM